MDAKSRYSSNVGVVKNKALVSKELAKKLNKARERRMKFEPNWKSVDLNETVERLAPGAIPEIRDGKIYFYNKNRTLAAVADVEGGYLRILDLTRDTKKARYLGLDGKDAHNVTENGKTRGRSKSEFLAVTHFRIKRRDEMK